MSNTDRDRRGEVLEKQRAKTDEPQLFRVLLHNDDYTPMEFVAEILEGLFGKSPAEAHRVMMQVHTGGQGIAGIYPHEVAETKVAQVHDRAQAAGHPLRASFEQE
jgi:ATP-dependent Clp protease adaptor protein ClpS